MSEPLFSAPTPDPFASALHKLRWARDGEWSVYLKPAECAALLDALKPPTKRDSDYVEPYYSVVDVVVSSSQTGLDAAKPGPN
jgi:hypothetical protein